MYIIIVDAGVHYSLLELPSSMYRYHCSCEEERDEWMSVLFEAINDDREKRKSIKRDQSVSFSICHVHKAVMHVHEHNKLFVCAESEIYNYCSFQTAMQTSLI